ncbi:hypothetical protein ACQZ48_21280 [Agrobacterium sp. 22-209-1]
MSVYVQRDEAGVVVGLYAKFQTGIAEELLEDDDPEVVAFLNPPEVLPPITKRQLRLTLVRNGISLETVEAAIGAMPEGLPKAEAQIEWADASTFNRNHPTLLLIAAALGLTEAQVDAMWAEAITA